MEHGSGKIESTRRGRRACLRNIIGIIGVSGGPDSTYLFVKKAKENKNILVAHVNHGLRGNDSLEDGRFVRKIAIRMGTPIRLKYFRPPVGHSETDGRRNSPANRPILAVRGEELARRQRYEFFRNLMKETGIGTVFLAHTADDQVETVLMRVLEGAGIAGLKGIPRRTKDGIQRPILHIWKKDVLKYLEKHNISYRMDESNLDTRFERNWIRHVLIPLLEERYGKTVKKRIFALGERFREIDRFLDVTARKWIGRNIKMAPASETAVFRRKPFQKLPSELRIRILQILCFEKVQIAPNERLLASMDRLVLSGGPSKSLAIGKGATLSCSYEDARMTTKKEGQKRPPGKTFFMDGPGVYAFPGVTILWKEKKGGMRTAAIRKRSAGEEETIFDAAGLHLPLTVRPLRYGDRIRPYGMDAKKRVKEILIDRKIPRDERWGRPVVCDAKGTILWIPGVIRSAHAPVAPDSRRTVQMRTEDIPFAQATRGRRGRDAGAGSRKG